MPRLMKRQKLAYILAASHSGSTLLAMLLGSHPQACTVGELKATSLGNLDTYRCSCGSLIRQCPFWTKISKGMADRGLIFDITNAGTDMRAGGSRYTARLLRPLHRGPVIELFRDAALTLSPTWRRALPRIQRVNAALVDTICEITDKRIVIDSSKISLRLKYLLRNPALDVRVVRLVRDGRAVALTYVDPATFANAADPSVRVKQPTLQLPFVDAARQWRRSNEEADHLLRRLDRSRWRRVRYEDYCRNPLAVLDELFGFLGLDPSRKTTRFRDVEHHVVGNVMRLDTTDKIDLDERWRDVLTVKQLMTFDRVAGRLNRRYGYAS